MFKEIIRKRPDKNEYIVTEDGIWVRNFTKPKTIQLDINNFWRDDCKLAIANEIKNKSKSNIFHKSKPIKKAIIVCDGYDYKNKQESLAELPKDIPIIGVNGSLAQWKLSDKERDVRRGMNAYLVNNPYPETIGFLPSHGYCPMCISSSRTYPEFLERYKNKNIYFYNSAPDKFYYGPNKDSSYKINDYRNPICAAIQILYHLGITKLMLFCFDDCFKDERPNSIKVENDLFCYKQQIIASNIIDSQLFWLKQKEILLGYHSSGLKLINGEYISLDNITNFFEG